ncbi:hypothetical protein SO694_0013605 [Aureococcus anophagefferens]|uniref:Uncharacterized protein n=1 Tax=Aureococcus anophagefferens TaxID=44056 RepID=A0ABR1GG84_AURAN
MENSATPSRRTFGVCRRAYLITSVTRSDGLQPTKSLASLESGAGLGN